MKTCGKCTKAKDLTEFYPVSRKNCRLRNACKSCMNFQNRMQHVANPEPKRGAQRKWAKANAGMCNAKLVKRRATKLRAMPTWLTSSQLLEIKDIYRLAKELQWLSEVPLEVDHEVPLQGDSVCGLHVPWNLRIITRPLNRSKGNKHDG
jgi:hypothetical protein